MVHVVCDEEMLQQFSIAFLQCLGTCVKEIQKELSTLVQ